MTAAIAQETTPVFEPNDLVADRLVQLLDTGAAIWPDQPAFTMVLPNGLAGTLSFGRVKALSDAVAHYLREERELPPGTPVAVQAPNCLAYPIVAAGILKAGMILTGINPLFTPTETRHQLQDSGAKLLFTIDLFADRLDKALEGTAVEEVIGASLADGLPGAKAAVLKTALTLKRQVPKPSRSLLPLKAVLRAGARYAAGDVARLTDARSLDDTVLFQYTSGTTGRSKGAEMSERNILANVTQTARLNGEVYRPAQETALVVLPLYHAYALSFALMQAARRGLHCVLVPKPRPLSNLKKVFQRHDITVLPGINTLFQGLLAEHWFQARPPKSLHFCVSGAAPLQQVTRERWEALTGCPIYEGYGLTEGTCTVSFPVVGRPQRPGTVGVPLPGTDLKLVGEDGADVAPGQPGEIVIRGPQVVKGYLNQPEATAETIKNGWLHTGDIGVIDPDGQLRIVDRKKDMIIVSGFNVYPAELEDCLARHPEIGEVAVVGAPCGATGEQVVAYVVPKARSLTEAAVAAHAKEHLTNYKRPRRVVFVDELPKSPVGKILRRELREDAKRFAD